MEPNGILEPVKPEASQLLQLDIQNKVVLHSHYMPFIKDGGIFIQTEREFEFEQRVVMLLRFLDKGKKLPISGRVVWISPKSGRGSSVSPGVGLQFAGDNRKEIQKAIEAYLGDLAKRPALHQAY
jgi:type IV pilus assembly protein PilZ